MTTDLEKILAQRAEATGVSGERVPFEFGGRTFTFRDPMLLTDDEKDELAELNHDVDVAEFYMGEDEYDKFINTTARIITDEGSFETQGSASLFVLAFQDYMKKVTAEADSSHPTRSSRSSRRQAQRKQNRR